MSGGYALFQYQVHTPVVVIYIKPVSDLFAVTIYRQGFIKQDIDDYKGDKLFRKLKGAVVVGTITDGGVKPVGLMVCTNQMVGGGLAGSIGGIWRIGC